ncbi:ABC transporter substrate-binding protein [Gordonia aichiensis]|uniref:ABC transporter substrate-binding protein n=1 Tax=Gordonia aichiensis TaxID=36820 RepID=UPI003267DD02
MHSAARTLQLLALAVGAVIGVAGCASSTAVDSGRAPAGFPISVENCGVDVTFQTPPERVLLLESAPVTILDGIGVFDRVVARAGSFPAEYYPAEVAAKVNAVPALTDKMNSSGHLMISQEEVLSQSPDLVLALPEGVSRQALHDAGANALIQQVFCPGAPAPASFQTLYDEIGRYGRVFDRRTQAEGLVADLRARVADVERRSAGAPQRTAAVLYPTVGGGTTYAYGRGSMAQPQLTALGLTNVFGDVPERVFEVQPEELIDADPDVVILLYQGSPRGVRQALTSLPGAESMAAITGGRVITQLFNFTEPASPLTVRGLEMLADELDGR